MSGHFDTSVLDRPKSLGRLGHIRFVLTCFSCVYRTCQPNKVDPMQKPTTSHSCRVKAGLAKAAAKGRKGGRPPTVTDDQIRASTPLGTSKGAASVGLSVSTYIRRRRRIEESAENHD